MKIKILTLILISSVIFLTNCNNEEDKTIKFESIATISGSDLALCPCCGGWIINIEPEEFDKRFSELPQGSDIDLDSTVFPISVRLNWSESNEYCGKGIVIEAIELIE